MADNADKPDKGTVLSKPFDLAGMKGVDTEKLKALGAPLAKQQMAQLEKLSGPARELQERMHQLADAVSGSSTLGKIAKQIAAQQETIEEMKISELARMPTPRLPDPLSDLDLEALKHPAHETNERLERIEARFEQMEGIATEAGAIANGLQGAAVEFLVKFERAASDNDRAAKRAILIGAAAMVIAVLAPLVQITYTEFWRVPDDTAAMQAALAEMKTEIAGLREEQANVAAQLAAALAKADRDSAEILRDIRDLLRSTQPAAASEAVPAE